MHEPRPVEKLEILALQTKLFADHDCVGPNPFGMTTGQPIMRVQHRRQADELLCRFLWCRLAELARLYAPLQLTDSSIADGRPEPGRRLVGKHQGELEQRGKGKKLSKHPIQ